jgi:hypothetical protein
MTGGQCRQSLALLSLFVEVRGMKPAFEGGFHT